MSTTAQRAAPLDSLKAIGSVFTNLGYQVEIVPVDSQTTAMYAYTMDKTVCFASAVNAKGFLKEAVYLKVSTAWLKEQLYFLEGKDRHDKAYQVLKSIPFSDEFAIEAELVPERIHAFCRLRLKNYLYTLLKKLGFTYKSFTRTMQQILLVNDGGDQLQGMLASFQHRLK